MAKKTTSERIKELQEKQAQLKAQEKALIAREKEAERKVRTKRLIEIGGAVEKVLMNTLGADEGRITKEDLPALIDYLQGQEDRGKYFSKAIQKGRLKERPTEEQADDLGGLF